MRILTATLLLLLTAGLAAPQDEPIPMQFYEIGFAESRNDWQERYQDIAKFQRLNMCVEMPFGNTEVMMAASMCGEALNLEGLNLSEVMPLSQEEYCIRTVENGGLPLGRDEQSFVACEYTPESINAIRVAAGLPPAHFPSFVVRR